MSYGTSSAASGVATAGVGLALAVPIVLAGGAIYLVARGLSAASRAAFQALAAPRLEDKLPDTILSPSVLSAALRSQEARAQARIAAARLPAAEALKVTTLAALTNSAFVARAEMLPELQGLQTATTLQEAKAARQRLLAAVELEHRGVLTEALVNAASLAAKDIGFTRVRTLPSTVNATRLMAEDADHRAIAIEISANGHGDPVVDVEAVGIPEGACVKVIEGYMHRLADRGVRLTPRGGRRTPVPTSEVAQEVAKQMASPASRPQARRYEPALNSVRPSPQPQRSHQRVG